VQNLQGACIAGLMMKSGDGTALSLLGGGLRGGTKVSAFPPQEQSRHRLIIFYHVFASAPFVRRFPHYGLRRSYERAHVCTLLFLRLPSSADGQACRT